MRRILIGFMAAALFAFLLAGCRHIKDETPAEATPAPEGPHTEGQVIWGGTMDGTQGVNRLNAETLESFRLFSVSDLAALEVAAGGKQFLITDSAGGVVFRTLDGFSNTTEAVSPASFSPNGRRVLFVRDGNLYETASAGIGARLLVPGAVRPRFSPDLSLLAYTTVDGFFIESPGSVDPQPVELSPGGIPQLDDPDPALLPAFSPDGTLVAAPMVLDIGEDRIETFMFIIDVASKTVVTWVGNGRYPSWAKEGQVAYTSDGLIYVWDVSEETNFQVTSDVEVADMDPLFSDDGNKVLFKRIDANRECLFTAELDTQYVFQLIECGLSPIVGTDWVRTSTCPAGNTAPDLTGVEILVNGTAVSEPVNVPAGATVVARMSVSDADCNLERGIAFASADGVAQRAIQFDFPGSDGCASDAVDVTVPDDYSGDVTLAFSMEDECGATSAAVSVQFTFTPGDDDVTDDTADDTSSDDTAADDTGGDDTAV